MKKIAILLLAVMSGVFLSACTLDLPGMVSDHWSKKNRDARR